MHLEGGGEGAVRLAGGRADVEKSRARKRGADVEGGVGFGEVDLA